MSNLKISAFIYAEKTPTSPLVQNPKKLNLQVENMKTEQKVTFKNITMDTLQMKLVWTDDKFLEITGTDATIAPGKTADLLVKVKKDRPDEYFNKSFTIEVNDKDHTRMTVPVGFNMKPKKEMIIKKGGK